MNTTPRYTRTVWGDPAPGRVMGPGHPVGDLLRGPEWTIVEEREGYFKIEVPLVDSAKNYRGHLFGGFAPTYVDLIALRTVSAGRSLDVEHGWLVTVNMRVDFFDPVTGPTFVIESEIVHRRGKTILVQTKFHDHDGKMLVFAITTLRES